MLTPGGAREVEFELFKLCQDCAKMTLDHQCEAVDSDSSWEDLESEEELYPTFDPDKNWAQEFSNSIQRFHGSSPLI